jgi:hypothetical protein
MKKYFIVFGILVVIILGIALYYNAYLGSVSITVAPQSSTITLNKKPVKLGTTKVSPGTYQLKVEKSGFDSQSFSVEVKSGKITTEQVALLANGPEGLLWYQTHPDDKRAAEAIAGQEVTRLTAKIAQKNKITALLPFFRRDFKIDYGKSQKNPNDPTDIALYITYVDEESKQRALDWIRTQGYDPSQYEIVYTQVQ